MRRVVAVVAGLVLVGVGVSPARGGERAVMVVTGAFLGVGDSFDAPCTKDAVPMVVGRGIGVPVLVPKVADLAYKWIFQAPGPPVGLAPSVLAGARADREDGTVEVVLASVAMCGNIAAVGGQQAVPRLGPWCGMHKAYNGKGKIRWVDAEDGAVHWAQLSDVGWKFTVGMGVLLLGKVRQQATGPGGSKGAKLNKFGTVLSVGSARALPGDVPGGQSCVDPAAGGTAFRVDGVVAMFSDEGKAKESVLVWNDEHDEDADRNDSGLFCKGSYDSDDDGAADEDCPIYEDKPKPTKPKDA